MKGYNSDTYGDGAQKTGLVLSLVDNVTREPIAWPSFGPIPPEDIEWGDVAPHYGIHQFDLTSSPYAPRQEAA